jgi:TfoX/Sxy family transcriptional regulator of competence genes
MQPGVLPVYLKRMFGVLMDSMMFGQITENALYLRVGADNRLLHRLKSVTLVGSYEMPI